MGNASFRSADGVSAARSTERHNVLGMRSALNAPCSILGREVPVLTFAESPLAIHTVTERKPKPTESVLADAAGYGDLILDLLFVIVIGIK